MFLSSLNFRDQCQITYNIEYLLDDPWIRWAPNVTTVHDDIDISI